MRDYQNPNWRPPTVATAISESVLVEEKCSIAVATPLNAEVLTENKSSEFMGSSTEVDDVASSSFDRIISPIQKPTTVVGSFDGESSSGAKEDESQHCTTVAVLDQVDASDACSVKSARSTHSLASTHSM